MADFHLLVYGSLDKDVQYVGECRDLIAAEGLDGNVTLAGLGAAPSVLPRGWVFVNSSQSEGLPLALGAHRVNRPVLRSSCLWRRR
jgi:hypothetical protein